MKNKTKPIPASYWAFTMRSPAAILAARRGKPKGKPEKLFRMEANWAAIPNTLFEDAAGQLWLAFTADNFPPLDNIVVDEEAGFLQVSIQEALEWMENALQFTDGYDGDPVDICRLALREIRSRPIDLQRVEKAIREELADRMKPRRPVPGTLRRK